MVTPDEELEEFLLTSRLDRLEAAQREYSKLYRRLHRTEQRLRGLAEAFSFVLVWGALVGIVVFLVRAREVTAWDWAALAIGALVFACIFRKAWESFEKE